MSSFSKNVLFGENTHTNTHTPVPLVNLVIFFPPQELYADIQSQFLPEMLSTMLKTLYSHMDTVSLEDVTQSLRACFKVLSKIQMPVAYMDIDALTQLEDTPLPEEDMKKKQVWLFTLCSSIIMVLVFNCR